MATRSKSPVAGVAEKAADALLARTRSRSPLRQQEHPCKCGFRHRHKSSCRFNGALVVIQRDLADARRATDLSSALETGARELSNRAIQRRELADAKTSELQMNTATTELRSTDLATVGLQLREQHSKLQARSEEVTEQLRRSNLEITRLVRQLDEARQSVTEQSQQTHRRSARSTRSARSPGRSAGATSGIAAKAEDNNDTSEPVRCRSVEPEQVQQYTPVSQKSEESEDGAQQESLLDLLSSIASPMPVIRLEDLSEGSRSTEELLGGAMSAEEPQESEPERSVERRNEDARMAGNVVDPLLEEEERRWGRVVNRGLRIPTSSMAFAGNGEGCL